MEEMEAEIYALYDLQNALLIEMFPFVLKRLAYLELQLNKLRTCFISRAH